MMLDGAITSLALHV